MSASRPTTSSDNSISIALNLVDARTGYNFGQVMAISNGETYSTIYATALGMPLQNQINLITVSQTTKVFSNDYAIATAAAQTNLENQTLRDENARLTEQVATLTQQRAVFTGEVIMQTVERDMALEALDQEANDLVRTINNLNSDISDLELQHQIDSREIRSMNKLLDTKDKEIRKLNLENERLKNEIVNGGVKRKGSFADNGLFKIPRVKLENEEPKEEPKTAVVTNLTLSPSQQ